MASSAPPPPSFSLRQVGKAYRIYPAPIYRLKEILLRRPQHRLFHALTDITLDIQSGGAFGVVGENGAGKSTLLRILSNTLQPSSGTISRLGRIAAILEIGAGFNPELSGAENIDINAYLMGLTRAEINARRADIIDFAEIDEFIERPVKSYSSGMVLRLAFSIATSVDPDVVIIDEALAVGDLHFQKKCVDRMAEFTARGKTLVFCSHSMYMVKQLCSHALWLRRGRIAALGEAGGVVDAYEDFMRAKDAPPGSAATVPAPSGPERAREFPELTRVALTDSDGVECPEFSLGDAVRMVFSGPTNGYAGPMNVGFSIKRNDDLQVYAVSTEMDGVDFAVDGPDFELTLELPSLALLSGTYFVGGYLLDRSGMQAFDIQERIATLVVRHSTREQGTIRMDHRWVVEGS